MRINPDFGHVRKVIDGLERNQDKYGKPYCPCKVQRTDSNVCPCIEARHMGECKCKLYVYDD